MEKNEPNFPPYMNMNYDNYFDPMIGDASMFNPVTQYEQAMKSCVEILEVIGSLSDFSARLTRGQAMRGLYVLSHYILKSHTVPPSESSAFFVNLTLDFRQTNGRTP